MNWGGPSEELTELLSEAGDKERVGPAKGKRKAGTEEK